MTPELIPQLGVCLALGLNSSARLQNAHAVRFVDDSGPRWALAARNGREFVAATPVHAERLERDRLSWRKCGRGWKIRKVDAELSEHEGWT